MAPPKERTNYRENGRRQRHESREHHRSSSSHLTRLQADAVAAMGEFVGTFLFLFFAYAGHLMASTQALAGDNSQTVVFISLAYSMSLLVTAWAFYRISGGLFNPAVTLGLCASSQLPWDRGAFLIAAQLVSCMCAGGIVSAMFPASISLAETTLAPGVSLAQGLFMEMFFTAYLVFVVLMLAVEKSRDTFIAPIGIGLALFVAELAGVNFTGGSLNPARSFGCAVAARSFPGYHWIYWLGPAMGALLAAGFYRLVKMAHYEEANPGQDDIRPEGLNAV